jgi:hypothetical protein
MPTKKPKVPTNNKPSIVTQVPDLPGDEKTAAFMSQPNQSPEDTISQIMGRASGGKIAVLERGSRKPTIIDHRTMVKGEDVANPMADTVAENNPNANVDFIPIPEDDLKEIQSNLNRAREMDIRLGVMVRQFEAQKAQLIEAEKNAESEFIAIVKSKGRKLSVPDGWVVDVDRGVYCPAPNRRA